MEKYKHIMKFVKIEEKIPDFKNPQDDPFSEQNVVKAFKKEEATKYIDQEQLKNKIHHRSVMYIVHDIFSDILRQGRISKNIQELHKDDQKKSKKLSKIEQKLKEIDGKIEELDNTETML